MVYLDRLLIADKHTLSKLIETYKRNSSSYGWYKMINRMTQLFLLIFYLVSTTFQQKSYKIPFSFPHITNKMKTERNRGKKN